MMLLLAALVASGQPAVDRAGPAVEWDAPFDRTDGWIGADAAYSIPLSRTRTLWLFGDTWVGQVRKGSRAGSTMVNNSISIQEGKQFEFPVPLGPDGKPRSFFQPKDGQGYFWPQGGALAGDRLVVVLTRVESTAKGGPFGFRLTGQSLAVIENFANDPGKWRIEQVPLTHAVLTGEKSRTFGMAVLATSEFVYFYGVEEPPRAKLGGKRLILARAPAAKAADPAAWEFRSGGRWRGEPGELDVLARGVANEGSVSYLPGRKEYVLVYTEHGLSDRIVGRFATAPEGPWSDAVLLYTCPEMKADRGLFTYAAKAHPHLAAGDELVVSYCVNAQDFWRVARDASLYRPRFVRVRLRR